MNVLAQIGGPVSALGVFGLLLGRRRIERLLALLTIACGAALVFSPLMPSVSSPLRGAAIAAGIVAVVALARGLWRWPWLLPVLTLAFVPARLPIRMGGSSYNLLVPLYVVIAAAVLVLVYELVRGDKRYRELGAIAWPLAAFVAWSSISIAWSMDIHEGAIELDAFLLPFTLLALALARFRWSRRVLRALLVELVVMALAFAVIGIYQSATRTTFLNPRLWVSNAYTSFFRVNSVFWDPSIYGRFLVVAILACLVVVLTRSKRPWPAVATAAIVVLWIGLLLSFSQSSFAALLAGVMAAALVTWRRRAAFSLAIAAVLVAGIGLATPQIRARVFDRTKGGLNRITSDRFALVRHGVRIAVDHPVAGVGIGGFKRAYANLTGLSNRALRKAASHTTPVTVAAETGIAGLALYVWVISVALIGMYQRARPSLSGRTELVCALVLTAIVVHSLFYAGFFEDPMVWGLLAMATGVPLALSSGTPGD
ncbi:MAG: O-antigen ligase family protein [Gaiellaceae bacterium]